MKSIHSLSRMAALAAAGAAGAGLSVSAQAEELGRVISTTPVLQQVAVPRQVCTQEQVISEGPKSGAGAVIGAIVGGVLGHTVGNGTGQAVATGIGMVGGAAVGDYLHRDRAQEARTVQRCTNQTFYENRTVAYNVVYEYAGKQFSVQMPQDPGTHVRLQITPVGGTAPQSAAPAPAPAPTTYVAPVPAPTTYVAPAVVSTTIIEHGRVYVPHVVTYAPSVVVRPVVYPTAYVHARPHYRNPPVAVSVNLGYSNGHRHPHRHRHW